jgi:hypothetical protein
MKHTAIKATAVALLCAASQGFAFVVIDDNSELFVTAAANVQFDDNVFLDASNEVDDVVYSFTPGLDLKFGNNAATSGNFFYKEEFRKYADNDNQDTSLSNVGFNSTYENGVTKFKLAASYAQLAQNDNNINPVGDIARREVTSLDGRSEFGLTAKTKLGVGLTYGKTDYKPTGYVDSTITTVPVDVYFEATPKLDWSVGYQYRQTNLAGAAVDSDDNFFNIGARGEFTPKLNGQVRVGYTQRDFDNGRDESLFGVGAKLGFAYSEKTSYQITVDNDFGAAGTGESTKNFSVGVNASSKLTEQWFLNAGLNFRKIDYPSRDEDYTEGMVAVAYKYNEWVDFSGSLTLRDNSSTLAATEFANTVFSFGANVRY